MAGGLADRSSDGFAHGLADVWQLKFDKVSKYYVICMLSELNLLTI